MRVAIGTASNLIKAGFTVLVLGEILDCLPRIASMQHLGESHIQLHNKLIHHRKECLFEKAGEFFGKSFGCADRHGARAICAEKRGGVWRLGIRHVIARQRTLTRVKPFDARVIWRRAQRRGEERLRVGIVLCADNGYMCGFSAQFAIGEQNAAGDAR
jgi:hypothetical protein